MKDGRRPYQLAQDQGVYCVEMEAVGLVHDFPYLVIQGNYILMYLLGEVNHAKINYDQKKKELSEATYSQCCNISSERRVKTRNKKWPRN